MRNGESTMDETVPDITPKRASNDTIDKALDTSPLDPTIPSFSIGLTQLGRSDTPHTSPVTMERVDVIHTLLPSRTVVRPTGADMERIYRWATNVRAKNDITLAWIKNGDNIKIIRRDLKSMGTRKQLYDTVVDYCCAMFNASDNPRFQQSFYCFTPRIMWLYVLHRKSENQWVLDSVNKEPNSDRRKNIDAYVGMVMIVAMNQASKHSQIRKWAQKLSDISIHVSDAANLFTIRNNPTSASDQVVIH
ncbi:hypothetical protein PIB30_082974 [Stylosanthes scabra]|uniref:Uncharacterized protein n=1 Tax=Stylosanthes scabra TaxID=79078 RepID=A0ABU6VU65_9FABA|nr:hypothetical protein [Stylosanthes scabra]